MPTTQAQIVLQGVDRTRNAFASVDRGLSGIGSKVKGLVPQLAALGTVTGLAIFSKNLIDTQDRLAKLSAQTGTSVETLSEFKHVAELTGIEFDGLAQSLELLTARSAKAAQGFGPGVRAFEQLNINAGTFSQLNTGEQFEALANAVQNLGDDVRATAGLSELFGNKLGVKLLPVLKNGAAGIADMREEARKLGIVFNDETAKNAEKLNDDLTRLKAAFTGLWNEVLVDVVPAFIKLAEVTTNLLVKFREFRKSISEAFDRMGERANKNLLLMHPYLAELDQFKKKSEEVAEAEKKALEPMAMTVAKYTGIVSSSISEQKQQWVELSEHRKGLISAVEDFWDSSLNHTTDAFMEFVETGKVNFRGLINSMLSDLIRFTTKKAVLEPMFNALSDVTTGFLSGSSSGSRGVALPIPQFANGGTAVGGMPAIVGEKGPELIIPQATSTIVPNNQLGGPTNIKVEIINQSSSELSAQQGPTINGVGTMITQIIVKDLQSNGKISKNLQSAFGVRRGPK